MTAPVPVVGLRDVVSGGGVLRRRCEQTNRQLLKAIESLARVRRLLTPMQINIGQNQINVTQ